MPPIIVSAKVYAVIVAGFTACLNHVSSHVGSPQFEPGWENCPAIMALESRIETQDVADEQARIEANDKAALAAAIKELEALKAQASAAAALGAIP